MSALQVVEEIDGSALDPLVARLDDILAELREAIDDHTEITGADRIDRISALERLRGVTAALQLSECVRFGQSQVAGQLAADVHPRAIGRGVADQIALACHIWPFAGSRRLGVARALWFDLPHTYAGLAVGDLSEHRAEIVVTETRHLDGATRRAVDAEANAAGMATMGTRSAAACIRRHAYEADRQGYLDRGRTERRSRRVGLRPAPDTMSILTGYLPVEQDVACYAALRRQTDATVGEGDPRTRDQIMADLLVERLTGQSRAQDVGFEVQLLMPLDSLTDAGSGRAPVVPGFGPLPVEPARELVSSSRGRRWWRRLFTAPTGQLVGGDPQRRRFDGWLAKLIQLRDQTCRDPYCDAAIRHHDHISGWATGGATTLANGRGTCARGNYVREMPGWRVDVVDRGQQSGPHTTVTTTPTGHHYLSRAPAPP